MIIISNKRFAPRTDQEQQHEKIGSKNSYGDSSREYFKGKKRSIDMKDGGFNLICRLNLFAKKKLQTNQNISNLIC